MVEEEEPLGSGDDNTAGVVVPKSEAAARGVAEAVAGVMMWRAPEVSPPKVPKKWILKGKAPSLEATWVPATSCILDLRFQRKELLPAPIQFLCPCGTTVGWSDWVEQERCEGTSLCGAPYSYVAAGFCCPNPFPNARPESQEFGLNDYEKIPNFLLMTPLSFIPYLSGAGIGLTQYNPHRVLRQFGFDQDVSDINTTVCALSDAMQPLVHDTTIEYLANKVERVLIASRHREGEKNIIAKAPESNLATSAPKRSYGKSPSSEDKPKKVRQKRASAEKPKASSPKPPAVVQSGSGAALATKSNVPAVASASSSSPLNESEETQSEGYDFEYMANDFGKLLFLALVSSHVSFVNILCSLGPTDEGIEMAGESPIVDVTAGEAAVGKGPKVTVIAGEAVAGVSSQGHIVSPTVHDAHHSKEPPELRVESSSVAIKGMSLEEFLEKFAKDKENEKVATNFYPLSSDIVMFQGSEIPTEGQPLLAAMGRKHLHFMVGCKLSPPLRKSELQLLVAVLLDMRRTKLESSNLKKVLKWKNALKDLLFMNFGVQFILDNGLPVKCFCKKWPN
nr:hypothetical protein CFP56_71786 [Quercus suber]